jgi:hypothetical protein
MLFDPIIECVYGWGQVLRLYDDHLDIGGTSYALIDLVAVYPMYYRVMGISSARLDLCFKQKKVVLRGIAATETVQRVASYLNTFCCLQTPVSEVPVVSRMRVDQSPWCVDVTKEKRQTDEALQVRDMQQTFRVTDHREYDRCTDEYRQTEQNKAPLLRLPHWQLPGQEQRQRRIKRLQAERVRREHGFDVEQLALRLQSETLPQVYVPTHLLADECAHYYTNATVCEEPPPGVKPPVYRVKDQGMLILTDRRIIYIGRRRQFVLDYRRLLHVSRLQGAIAIMSENWAQRELFEMRFPLECTMYLDAILLRYRKEAWHVRTNARVRQLYPSTKTSSYDMHSDTHRTATSNRTATNTTAFATGEQWHSSELFNK